MSEETTVENENKEEVVEEQYDGGSRVQVGLHPLGGIGITVVGLDGSRATARLGVEEAWTVAGHLSSIAAFMIGTAYTKAITEQAQAASPIVIPRR